MTNLKLCPFCGHTAVLHRDDDGRFEQVVCGGCGAKGSEQMRGNQPSAIDRWNQRSSAEPIRESLMATCYECDNCKVFTPINREHCSGCGRTLNQRVEPETEPDDDGCTGVDGTCPIHALHGAFVSNK